MTNLKTFLIGAVLAAGAVAPAAAQNLAGIPSQAVAEAVVGPISQGTSFSTVSDYPAGTVVVSCFRGPWRETIWDHPEPVFVDSLRAVGYDYATAESIANRICRDYALVGNDAGLKAAMEAIVRESPNFREY